MYYIYKATNKINGKIYIGQTLDFKRRKSEHLSAKNGVHAKCIFHKAIQKYGKENFEWEIIDTCQTLDESLFLESLYIAQYNSCTFMKNSKGYNIVYTQHDNMRYVHNCQKVISYDLAGNFIKVFDSYEQAGRELNCQPPNISKCVMGERKSTGGYQFKPYKKNFPKKISPYKTNEQEAKYKAVYQYDKSFSFVKKHHSLQECAEDIGVTRNAIANAMKENRPCKQYYFSYKPL